MTSSEPLPALHGHVNCLFRLPADAHAKNAAWVPASTCHQGLPLLHVT